MQNSAYPKLNIIVIKWRYLQERCQLQDFVVE